MYVFVYSEIDFDVKIFELFGIDWVGIYMWILWCLCKRKKICYILFGLNMLGLNLGLSVNENLLLGLLLMLIGILW